MAYDLYPLPLFLKFCEHVDTTVTWYLNQTHAPLDHPLKKSFHIELYNEQWFTKPIQTSPSPITYQHDTLQLSKNFSITFPSVLGGLL